MDINIKQEKIETTLATFKIEPEESPSIDESKDIKDNIKRQCSAVLGNESDKVNDAVNSAEAVEEDVPTDFFDDFSNKDFLAGLDVVDAWGEDEEANSTALDDTLKLNIDFEKSIDDEASKETPAEVPVDALPIQDQQVDSNNHEQPEQTIPVELPTFKDATSKNSISKTKEKKEATGTKHNTKKSATTKRRSRSPRSIHKHCEDRRRDPDKVRRDIQRDKEKCEKDRITEKLKIVETGTVPPGTEMDVPDTNSSNTTKVSLLPSSTVQRLKPSTRDDKYSPRPPKRALSRSPSPYRRKRRLSPSPQTNSRRRHSPSSSAYRRRSRSPIHAALDRFEDRRNRNRSKSNSPARRYPRHSNEHHSSSKHSRDKEYPSEVRKPSFLEELDAKLNSKEKVSLKNIAAKLNGSLPIANPMATMDNHIAHHSMHHNPMMIANPNMSCPQIVPVPPPILPAYSDIVYDQQFFVGNVDIPSYNSNVYAAHAQASYLPYQQRAYYGETDMSQYDATYEEDDAKLFNDENISLTEYLKLSRRTCDNMNQTNLSQKVKVLNRCQDSMKLMSELARPNGHFYCNTVKLPQQNDKSANAKKSSYSSNIRFLYTSKRHILEDKQPTALNRLISKLGVKEKLRNHNFSLEPTGDQSTQTVNQPCLECETRKQVKTVDVGTQAEPETNVFSGQVNDEDFLSTARSALKSIIQSNQSFSTLTSAQLRASIELDQESKHKDYEHRFQMEERMDRERRGAVQEYERRPVHPEADYDRHSGDRQDWNSRGNFLLSPSSHSSTGPRPLHSLLSNISPLMSRMPSSLGPDPLYGSGNSLHGQQAQQQGSYRPQFPNARPGLLQPPPYGSRNFMNNGRFSGNQY